MEQLVLTIEEQLAARGPAPPPLASPATSASPRSEPSTQPPRDLARGRWLVIADEEPEAVLLESYAERTAGELRELGQEVRVTRARRRELSAPDSARELELDSGPLPRGLTSSNRMLMRGPAFERRLAGLVSEWRPDAILAEGPLGGLLGPSLARRLGVPLVFLLRDCEVARRGNHLTREELYLAQLERWACERSARVAVPSTAVGEAAARHYALKDPWLLPVPTRGVTAPREPERLLRRLGVLEPVVLVLGGGLDEDERQAVLGAGRDRATLLLGAGVVLCRPGAAPVEISGLRPRGPALGALLAAAHEVHLAERCPELEADAWVLGRRTLLLVREQGRLLAVPGARPAAGAPRAQVEELITWVVAGAEGSQTASRGREVAREAVFS